jgi:hypothetical protein
VGQGAAEPLVFVADPVPVVDVAFKHATVRARVSLGFDRAILLNLAAAERARLRPFPIVGKFRIRNPQIPGGEALIRGNLVGADAAGTGGQRLPTVWIDKDVARAPHEGVVSALAIRADRVIFRQPAAPEGRATYIVPRAGPREAHSNWRVGGETVRVVLDFNTPWSVMNARAAAVLERAGLAVRTGRVGLWSPVPALALPVEELRPAPGATVLGLPLTRPAARITPERARDLDAKAAAGIEGAVEEDEDAIVVTAERERQRGRAWLLIGGDVLGRCATIELDRPGARWVLSCAF